MLALLLSLQVVQAPAPRLHYRIVTTSTIDLGTGAAPLVLRTSAFVSITLADSSSNRTADVVVIWSEFDGGAMAASLPPQLIADARGVTLHANVDHGRLTSVTTSVPNLQAMQLVPAIQLAITSTRSVRPGETWVDSVATDSSGIAASSRSLLRTAWTAGRAAGNAIEMLGTIAGTISLTAGAIRLDLPTTGTSRITVKPGELAGSATAATSGQGDMHLGSGTLVMKVRNSVVATLFPATAWAAIP